MRRKVYEFFALLVGAVLGIVNLRMGQMAWRWGVGGIILFEAVMLWVQPKDCPPKTLLKWAFVCAIGFLFSSILMAFTF